MGFRDVAKTQRKLTNQVAGLLNKNGCVSLALPLAIFGEPSAPAKLFASAILSCFPPAR